MSCVIRAHLPLDLCLGSLKRRNPCKRNNALVGERFELVVFLSHTVELSACALALGSVSLNLALRLSYLFLKDRYLDLSCSPSFFEPPPLVAHGTLRRWVGGLLQEFGGKCDLVARLGFSLKARLLRNCRIHGRTGHLLLCPLLVRIETQ
jgi:hypothetical protein